MITAIKTQSAIQSAHHDQNPAGAQVVTVVKAENKVQSDHRDQNSEDF